MSSVVAQQLQQLLVVAGRKQGELAEVFQGQGMGMCKGDAPLKWKFPSSRRTGHSSKPTTLPVFQMLVGSACWGGERGGGGCGMCMQHCSGCSVVHVGRRCDVSWQGHMRCQQWFHAAFLCRCRRDGSFDFDRWPTFSRSP